MSFRLRPGQKGVERRLHSLEAAVMDVVWHGKLEVFCVSDVLHVLERDREIAYTTVMTTVNRLHEKGLLVRTRDGRRFLYKPTMTREEFLESMAREVLDEALGGQQAMVMLAERLSEASSSDLDQLEVLIRKRREDLKK